MAKATLNPIEGLFLNPGPMNQTKLASVPKENGLRNKTILKQHKISRKTGDFYL